MRSHDARLGRLAWLAMACLFTAVNASVVPEPQRLATLLAGLVIVLVTASLARTAAPPELQYAVVLSLWGGVLIAVGALSLRRLLRLYPPVPAEDP